MSDELDLKAIQAQAEQSIEPIKKAIKVAEVERDKAYALIESANKVGNILGAGSAFNSAIGILGSAAAGAATGAALGPIGAAVGGFVGFLIAGLMLDPVGTVTWYRQCTLPDGTKFQVRNQECDCYEQFQPMTRSQLDAVFFEWWNSTRNNFGYRAESKGAGAGKYDPVPTFNSVTDARAWWQESTRNPDRKRRKAIIENCLPKVQTAEHVVAAEKQFSGRFGDRWRFSDEMLFDRKVGEFPAWVPAYDSNVSRILLLAHDLRLTPEDLARIAALTDPRLGVSAKSQRIDELDKRKRREITANAVVMACAKSAGIVSAGEKAVREIEIEVFGLGIDRLDANDITQAWQRLASPALSYLPEPTKTTKTQHRLYIFGFLVLGAATFLVLRKRK